jgi:hypothetical protein
MNFSTQFLPALRKQWRATFPESSQLDDAMLDRFLTAFCLHGMSIPMPSMRLQVAHVSKEDARVAFDEYICIVKPSIKPTDPLMQSVVTFVLLMAMEEAVGGIHF